jgi:hypothetical protein
MTNECAPIGEIASALEELDRILADPDVEDRAEAMDHLQTIRVALGALLASAPSAPQSTTKRLAPDSVLRELIERLNAEARHLIDGPSYSSDVLVPLLRNAVEELEALTSPSAPSGWQPIAEAQVRCERVAKGLETALTFPSRLLLDTAVRESIKELRALPTTPSEIASSGWQQRIAAGKLSARVRDYLRSVTDCRHFGHGSVCIACVEAAIDYLGNAAMEPHTCHDMNPPFPGPCRACETERQNAKDAHPPASSVDWRGLIAPLVHFVAQERALRDAEGKGGQSVGDSPRISPSVLKELERMLAPVMTQVEKSCALPPVSEASPAKPRDSQPIRIGGPEFEELGQPLPEWEADASPAKEPIPAAPDFIGAAVHEDPPDGQ